MVLWVCMMFSAVISACLSFSSWHVGDDAELGGEADTPEGSAVTQHDLGWAGELG